MKKVLIIAALAAAATLSGCAMTPYQPGVYFTKQKTPIDSPNNAMSCSKQGTATATNVLGAFAFGDASGIFTALAFEKLWKF
jgi:outer membrane lipoprotein SlyB